MSTYISILRGINVSGQKKIKMVDLKALYEKIGLTEVVTYIQSGNVIFNSSNKNQKELARAISEVIKVTYDFDVPVIVLSKKEMIEASTNNPYLNQKGVSLEKLHITFLDDIPSQDRISLIDPSKYLPDEFIFIGKNLYLCIANGYGKSKLSNNFFENKLKVTATTRNMKTVLKLIELSQ